MKVIDLFCGAGGFSEGFKQVGFEIVAGVDNWIKALQSFKKNFPNAEVIYKDVCFLKKEQLPDFDILIGSPPCKEWSTGKGYDKRTLDDSLIKAFERIVIETSPKYWVWENAPDTIKYKGIDTYKEILNAYDFGVPQNRKRCFHSNFKLPRGKQKGLSLNEVFEWKEDKVLCHYRTLNTKARSPTYLSNRQARTVVTWPIKIINNEEIKEFTIEMMMKVQGFPKDFKFVGDGKDKFIQIGNAVCPPVAKAIAEMIKLEVNK